MRQNNFLLLLKVLAIFFGKDCNIETEIFFKFGGGEIPKNPQEAQCFFLIKIYVILKLK
jgi:hypothetical protein